ncbi:peptidoglycan-binding protein [Eubacteriales bacterium OttesenSCG-928-N13]|nr:peptidoglycan-binding protein [Eubacteriales bacterium OttesenSCG-928-N13]
MSAAQQRAEAVRLIKSRTKRNSYTQGANRGYVFGKPEGAVKGYGDCSSTVREVIKRAAGIDIGGNTSAQVANRGKGIMIEDNRDGKRSYPTIDRLTAADCIYYKGTKGNTWDVGHVEMYIGGGEIAGHGSGTGPTIKNCKAYSQSRTGARKYLCVIRWIKDDNITYKLGDRPLSYGMVASDVGELQTLLVQLGYDLGSYGANKNGVDNDYGSKTVKAVKLEQRCAGLAQTGTADVLTIDHIKGYRLI